MPLARLLTSGRLAALALSLLLALTLVGGPLALSPAVTAAQEGDESPSPSADPAAGESEIAEQIPPADLPTGNLRQLDLRIDAALDADLDDAPTEADVYSLAPPAYSADEVADLAEGLGIDGEVEDRGNDSFVVSGNGDLFVSPLLVQYLSSSTPTLADLPGDEEAIDFARDWLREVGLAPADLGEGEISSRTAAVGRVSVVFRPAEPAPILTADPNITVVVGPEGVVLEAGVRWFDISVAERYLLRPAEDAWREVEASNAYIEATFNDAELADGATVEGNATYTDISIAYNTAGPLEGPRYLVPIFVFTGEIEATAGAEGTSEIRAYVPAIVTEDTPVG